MSSVGYGQQRWQRGWDVQVGRSARVRVASSTPTWSGPTVAVGIAPAGQEYAAAAARAAALPSAGVDRFVLVVATLLAGLALWSISYLIRQPGLAMVEPPSLVGNFAVEGMLLALGWLAAFVAGAAAVATGIVAFQEPGR